MIFEFIAFFVFFFVIFSGNGKCIQISTLSVSLRLIYDACVVHIHPQDKSFGKVIGQHLAKPLSRL